MDTDCKDISNGIYPLQKLNHVNRKEKREDCKMATKSGWLHQYSGKLGKIWKNRYCVLYEDGYLSVFHKPGHASTEKRILLKRACKQILTGCESYKWNSIDLPKGVEELDCLFSIKVKKGKMTKVYCFAAQSVTDCEDWVSSLETAMFKTAMLGGDHVGVFAEAMLQDKKT
eukprot:Seg1539.9 transcript_id=Seg1539.9/GoldUCD/mRNA.D3Y31 product="Pleckstrin-like domain-containing family B member 2" protein_id=Seg1539.9/GoldUCD/D3Y31